MKDRVFISDLHLAPERPDIINLFLRFSDEIAANADELYILGDFLEYWLGDDDPAESLTSVFDKLIELDEKYATKLFFMHGNRDFLVGNKLAERCHFTLLDDPHKLPLQNSDALLTHGDTLCTDDIEYQQFRQMVRNPQWQEQILSKSLEERIEIAKAIREKSQQSATEKEEYIMDANQEAIEKTFLDNHISLLIHGHTHRPNIHKKDIGGVNTTRIVLGDWYKKGSYLRINDDTNKNAEYKLQTFQ